MTIVNSNASSVTWSNYLDLQNDVLPWIQIPLADDANVQSRVQLVIDMACQWVQNYLGRPIAPTTFERRFDGWNGWNGAYILLPYYPILEFVSVIEWWGISGPHVLSEQTPVNQGGTSDVFQADYQRGKIIRTFQGLVQRPFFPGSRNIEITWTAGYNPLPGDIKLATLELVAHWWRQTQQGARTNVRAGGDDADIVASGLWQGLPNRITNLLDSYVQVGMG